MAEQEYTRQSQSDEIDLVEIISILLKKKKFIVIGVITSAVVSAGVSLLIPNTYQASTRVLPPQQAQSSAVSMLGQLGGFAGGATGALGLKNPNDLYVSMLRSRTVADALVDRFKLQDLYETEFRDAARATLEKHSGIVAGKDGLISIDVEDVDPKRAAQIANAYVDELKKLTSTLAVTEAASRRQFFEEQLQKTKDNLNRAETDFKQMQQKTGVLMLEAQGKAIMDAIAKLKAEISAKEIALYATRTFATENNPNVQRLQAELTGLRRELANYQNGEPNKEGDLLASAANVPEGSLEYYRSMRELKYQEALFEQLSKQLEFARLDESKNSQNIQVLDRAIVPEHKFKPKRALIVMVSTILGAFVSVIGVLVLAAVEKRKYRLATNAA